ncbi:MAG: hypothetical protein ABI197_07270 [Granulicella sp.]
MRTLHATIFVVLCLAATASAQRNASPIASPPVQNTPPSQVGAPSVGGVPLGSEDMTPSPDAMHRLEIIRSNDRQKKMIADTDRLLALATELKADMDKTTKNTLSIEVIKKADEIEKLAHDIKQRMKN